MKPTPDACAAAYDCLRSFAPFKGWKLPSGEEVEFIVTRDPSKYGAHSHYICRDEHIIEISDACNGHLNTLMFTMAHEMVHLHQKRAKLVTKAEHNADFKRRAKSVCRELGWDEKAF